MNSTISTIETEIEGLQTLLKALQGGMTADIDKIVDIICKSQGHVIVTGMGKSGHIGRKISSTFSSLGIPSFFIHPGEASHGDLGMINQNDVIFVLSWSGETEELDNILAFASNNKIPVLSITSNKLSTLARYSDATFQIPKLKEACPNGLAPTTSCIAQLALGDAIALSLLEKKGFTKKDFYKLHPGGSLGGALTQIYDVMHIKDKLPLIHKASKMGDALIEMSLKGFGCVGIIDDDDNLTGIITDGDLRRAVEKNDLFDQNIEDVMSKNPITISYNEYANKVLSIMNENSISTLFVVECDKKPKGIIHIHDIVKLGIN